MQSFLEGVKEYAMGFGLIGRPIIALAVVAVLLAYMLDFT
jgi:hypothetical protein